MSLDTTTTANAATITENELWAHFLTSEVNTTIGKGRRAKAWVYCPDDLLMDAGMHGGLEDFSQNVADELKDSKEIEETLDDAIAALEGYAADLRTLKADFSRMKASLLVRTDEDDLDGDEVKDRYHVPA